MTPSIVQMLESDTMTAVCAPMVRYSKLPFRETVLKWGVDVVYTPMIMADVFSCSQVARECDFTSSGDDDRPLVVQFAARNACDFGAAARLVAPYADAVDLNCGCPQRWAIREKLGSWLLGAPPVLVAEMVAQARSQSSLPVSVKMRIHAEGDVRASVEFARQMEAAGAAWITVHGRTPSQRSSASVDIEAIRTIKQALTIPVIANGNVFSRADAEALHVATGANGVMAARGLLANPALFSGETSTPVACVREFVRASVAYGSCSFLIQQHVAFMMEERWRNNASLKRLFNTCTSVASILDFCEEHIF